MIQLLEWEEAGEQTHRRDQGGITERWQDARNCQQNQREFLKLFPQVSGKGFCQ